MTGLPEVSESTPDIERLVQAVARPRTVIVEFPTRVLKIDTHEGVVHVETPRFNGPFLAPGVQAVLVGHLSGVEQDRFVDDVIRYAVSESIRRSLVIHPA